MHFKYHRTGFPEFHSTFMRKTQTSDAPLWEPGPCKTALHLPTSRGGRTRKGHSNGAKAICLHFHFSDSPEKVIKISSEK